MTPFLQYHGLPQFDPACASVCIPHGAEDRPCGANPTPTKFDCAKYLLIGQTHKIRKWSKMDILRSPTWSELGTLDHPGSTRSIFCPVGHTYGCRRQVPGIHMVVNHDTGQNELSCCPPICPLFLGRLKKIRMCC